MTPVPCWMRLRRHRPGVAWTAGVHSWSVCGRCGRKFIVGTTWGGPK